MKTAKKIEEKLKEQEIDLSRKFILYECVGDYVRGWVAALKWVLNQK